MASRLSVQPVLLAAAAFLAIELMHSPAAIAEIIDVTVQGTVASNTLTRGPFVSAEVGDPVAITLSIDTDFEMGGGVLRWYTAIDYRVTIDGTEMTAKPGLPTFFFSTFATFHGFEMTSTGLLQPGGGAEHEYRIPIFNASGPPTFWLPEGSGPLDHIGCVPVSAFDFLGNNRIEDEGDMLEIAMTAIRLELAGSSGCAGDLDGSGDVGFSDLLSVLSAWGPCADACCDADLDADGVVGFTDLLGILSAWGPCRAP